VALYCASEPDKVPYGIYHFAGAGEATWFEFARTIVDLAGDRLPRSPQVLPIRTIDYPTRAIRGAGTRLDCTAVARAFGIRPRLWRQALADTIDRLLPKVIA
jgi:dTDP-4-dehydrorhamnose reductase